MRYLEFYSYIVFSSVQAAVSAKAVGVSSTQLIYILLHDIFECGIQCICTKRNVPATITQLFDDVLFFERVLLKQVFLINVFAFTRLTAQTKNAI